jgi:hypothetical protein
MAVEEIAEFKILPQNVEALMPPHTLQVRRMDVVFHARGQCSALKAVAAEALCVESWRGRAGLDDVGDGLGGQRLMADRGQGRGLVGRRVFRQPDPAKNRPLGYLRRPPPLDGKLAAPAWDADFPVSGRAARAVG